MIRRKSESSRTSVPDYVSSIVTFIIVASAADGKNRRLTNPSRAGEGREACPVPVRDFPGLKQRRVKPRRKRRFYAPDGVRRGVHERQQDACYAITARSARDRTTGST